MVPSPLKVEAACNSETPKSTYYYYYYYYYY